MNRENNRETVLMRLLRKRLHSGRGSAYMEFAFMAPLFLLGILFIFQILITLPRQQQLDIATRFYADALSFGVDDSRVLSAFGKYQKQVACIADADFTFTKETNAEDRRYLLRNVNMKIDDLFSGMPDFLRTILRGLLDVVSLGLKKPYFDAFFEIDDCHHAHVKMSAPSLLNRDTSAVDKEDAAEKMLVTGSVLENDYYMPSRNTGLGRPETYITKVGKVIRKIKTFGKD